MSEPAPLTARTAWILADAAEAEFSVWGLSAVERLRRSLSAAGCQAVRVLGPSEPLPPAPAQPSVLVRGDWIYDDRLVGVEHRTVVELDSDHATRIGEKSRDARVRADVDPRRASPAGERVEER